MRNRRKPGRAPRTDPGRLITVNAAAERIGRTPMTIRRMIRRKLLQAVLVGHTVMVLERSVESYLRPRPYKPQKPTPVCAGWNDKLRDELQPTKAQEVQS
jgi:hypothetical protein